MNELMTTQEVQNALGQLALKHSAVLDAIGVVQNSVKEHEREILSVKETVGALRDDFEAEKQIRKNRERIDAGEVNNLTRVICHRCEDLLRKEDRLDLLGKFTSKCRHDCKINSYYYGKSGVDTLRMYYNELIEYIGAWTPEGWGVVGYINHLG